MSRKKRSIQNVVVALLSEVMVTVSGMLLPSAIILNYGSAINGLVCSLQQIIQHLTLLEGGLAGAAVFALYKPLADNDSVQVSRILTSARKQYSRIGKVFIVLILALSVIYPRLIADVGYPRWVVSALFCLIGINGATQFLYIGKFKVLLNASQNNRYVVLLNALSTCLFSVIIVLASYSRMHVVAAVLFGCTAYVVRALGFHLVVRKLYPQYTFENTDADYKLENQREVFIQQLLSMTIMNASTLILSFSKTDMAEISVFTVYNMVLTAVLMLTNAVHNGVSASFGDLISRNDIKKLQDAYVQYEILYQVFWTLVFSCTSVLYLPFISLYTGRFTDAVYIRPDLCVLFSILGAVWSVRIQQSVLIVAAGKFKEIQRNSIVETVLAVFLAIVGMVLGGLEGMLLGRCLGAIYRMIDFLIFGHREVLKMNPWVTVKGILSSTAVILGLNLLNWRILEYIAIDSYIAWGAYAIGIAILAGCISTAVTFMVYQKQAAPLLGKIISLLRKKV